MRLKNTWFFHANNINDVSKHTKFKTDQIYMYVFTLVFEGQFCFQKTFFLSGQFFQVAFQVYVTLFKVILS